MAMILLDPVNQQCYYSSSTYIQAYNNSWCLLAVSRHDGGHTPPSHCMGSAAHCQSLSLEQLVAQAAGCRPCI